MNSRFVCFAGSIVLAMGLMLSPDSLTLLGNNMGAAGISFLAVLLMAMIVHLFNAFSYGGLLARFPGPGVETRCIKEALGPIPALFLPLCSRLLFTLCASVGILATAGYVFNEVFVYWFPNLGFSFCLLGLLLVINILGRKFSELAQIFFVTITISGLLFLSIYGIIESENILPAIHGTDYASSSVSRVFFSGLLLLVGFDLAGFIRSDDRKLSGHLLVFMITAIILIGIVFCLWGLVSIIYVPSEKLSESTVPYMIAGRAILDQNGRICMGIVVLTGACSVVNVLLIAVSRMIAGMANQRLLPAFLGTAPERALIPLILLATGVTAMLAMGIAGVPALEIYTRAGLWFWLLNYAAVHLAVLIVRKRVLDRPHLFQFLQWSVVPVIGLIVMIISLSGLVWFDENPTYLVKAILLIFLLGFLFSFFWISLGRRKGRLLSNST